MMNLPISIVVNNYDVYADIMAREPMDKTKQEFLFRNEIVDAITLDECPLDLADYDNGVPEFIKMYHALALSQNKTITNENDKASITDFVQDLTYDQLSAWVQTITVL